MSLRVAIAHDWFTQYAGSERCVVEMARAFPDARILTALIDRSAVPAPLSDAEESLLRYLPAAHRYHKWLLPLMPLAWSLREPVRDVDAIISSSHACAKAVRMAEGIPHVCYCHEPMRYAWDFHSEKRRIPRRTRAAALPAMAWFRRWDRLSARRVDRFVANSSAVARRIRDCYGRSSEIVPPPVRTDLFTPGAEREDFFLYVGRLVSYKRPDFVVDAFSDLPFPLRVVGDGHLREELERRAAPNVTFLGQIDDPYRLRDLYRSARALVYPANEAFGIVMAEAQACGTPVIGLAGGGADDIVIPDRTGWLIPEQSQRALERAVRTAARVTLDAGEIRAAAERFSAESFRVGMRRVVAEIVEASANARARAGGGSPHAAEVRAG